MTFWAPFGIFSLLAELAQPGTFDFQSEEGKKAAALADDARLLLENEFELYMDLLEKSESKLAKS